MLTLVSGPNAYDEFGYSVALSTNVSTALVGAFAAKVASGAAYIFVKTNGVWSNGTALTLASGPSGQGRIGRSAAVSENGSMALVGGAPYLNGFPIVAGAAFYFSYS